MLRGIFKDWGCFVAVEIDGLAAWLISGFGSPEPRVLWHIFTWLLRYRACSLVLRECAITRVWGQRSHQGRCRLQYLHVSATVGS